MKKIIFLSTVLLFVITTNSLNATCFDYCEYGGCSVNFYQGSGGWGMDIWCDGEPEATPYTGSGQYEGTICGGHSPCTEPMEN